MRAWINASAGQLFLTKGLDINYLSCRLRVEVDHWTMRNASAKIKDDKGSLFLLDDLQDAMERCFTKELEFIRKSPEEFVKKGLRSISLHTLCLRVHFHKDCDEESTYEGNSNLVVHYPIWIGAKELRSELSEVLPFIDISFSRSRTADRFYQWTHSFSTHVGPGAHRDWKNNGFKVDGKTTMFLDDGVVPEQKIKIGGL